MKEKKPTTKELIAALQKRVEELEKRPQPEKVVEHHYHWYYQQPYYQQQPWWQTGPWSGQTIYGTLTSGSSLCQQITPPDFIGRQ